MIWVSRHQKKHSIDRIDNDKGYFPENCRWATSKEQSTNKRSNILIEHKGIKLTISQWCEKLDLKFSNVSYRYKNGWDIDKVLSKQTFRGKTKATINK